MKHSLAFLVCTWAVLITQPLMAQDRPVFRPGELAAAGLVESWRVQLPLPIGTALRSAYVVEDNLYLTTSQGDLLCLDRFHGLVRWRRPVARPGIPIQSPTHIDVGGGRRLTAIANLDSITLFDTFDGQIAASWKPDFAPRSPVVGSGGVVAVAGNDNRLHAFAWCPWPCNDPAELWQVWTPGGLRSGPQLIGQTGLLFSAGCGQLTTCTLAAKQFVWEQNWPDCIQSEITLAGESAYVGFDFQVAQVALNSGAQTRLYRVPGRQRGPVMVDATRLYVPCENRTVYGLDLASGDVIWRYHPAADVAALLGDKAILVDNNRVAVVEADSGKVLGVLMIDRFGGFARNQVDESLYVFRLDGQVSCVQPMGSALPSAKETRDAAWGRNLTPRNDEKK